MSGRQHRRPREMRTRMGSMEVRKVGGARFDWRNPYHVAVSLSWPHFMLAFLGAETVVNLLFGLLYLLQPGCIANLPPGSLLTAVFFSLETFATVGYGVMAPATLYGHIVSSAEILCGVIFTAIVTGLVFVRFSRPRAQLVYASQLVVARHDGRPTLMLRLGNRNINPLLEAHARLSVLMSGTTAEGQLYRRSVDLKLAQPRLPVFGLSWTLMHVLDASSPLAGLDAATLPERVVRIFVAIEGRDAILATTLLDTRDYQGGDVAFGMRYADVVRAHDDGVAFVDLTRISNIEPEAAAGGQAGTAGAPADAEVIGTADSAG